MPHDKFTLDVRQAAELTNAFERNHFTPADIKKMSGGEFLAQLLPVIRGYAEVKHVIDCDADPFIPHAVFPYKSWTVENHRKGGQFIWEPTAVKLHLLPDQLNGQQIYGYTVGRKLEELTVLNANVLDYLLRHPYLIPEEWKWDEQGNTRYIYFWGTTYVRVTAEVCVRCLYFENGHWCSGDSCLGANCWASSDPAAVYAA